MPKIAKVLKEIGDLKPGDTMRVQSLGQITGNGYVFPKRLVEQGFFEIQDQPEQGA